MRLLELGLLRFGGFTDARLDFSGPGLHVIHGRNEAGKSTALRGISCLLYGFPHRTSDAYLHDELLLSGRVRAADGGELAFERRKGRKNTLLSPTGEALEERVLSRLLGGVNQSMFETTFGLDHGRLRAGGELLAAGGGDVGQSLFDAGIGGGSVKRVLDELEKEASDLFNARARNPEINVALREYAEKVKLVRAESTRPEAWAQQKKALEDARSALAEIEARRAEQKRLLGAAQELVEVLPLIAKREAAERELVPVAHAALLHEDATERRIAAEKELDAAEREERRLAAEKQEIAGAVGLLVISDALLLLTDSAVDALHERLGEYRRDQTDLGKRRRELAASEAIVARRLAALGHRLDHDNVRALIPNRTQVARIKALTVERARLGAELEQAKKRQAEQRAAVAALEAELALATGWLSEAGAPASLIDRILPSLESIDAFKRQFDRLETRRDRLEERRQTLEREAATERAELTELRLAGQVPTEVELARVRLERDAGFAAIRDALTGRAPAEPDAIRSFEGLGRQADELADRLRREASRVARFLALEARLGTSREALIALETERAALDVEQGKLEADWRASWDATGVAPGSPAEMRGLAERWLRARERRRDLDLSLGRARALSSSETSEREERERSLDAWQVRWAEAVRLLGLGADATPAEADDVYAALGELKTELDKCDELRHRISGMEQSCDALERDVAELTRQYLPGPSDVAGGGVEQAAGVLIQRHRQNRDAARTKDELDGRRARALAQASDLAARSEAAQGELASLMQAAGVEHRSALAEAEVAAAKRRRAERDIADLDRALAEACGSASLDAVRERARGVSLHEARARANDLDEALAELDRERDAARDRLRSADHGLELFEGGETAANAQVEAETLLAKIRAAAERWARVRTAWRVLHNEVERYRATHQAPLLSRANQLFPRLTAGQYAELRVDHDAEPPLLSAVAPDGSRVPIPSLSEGARDQLYLALRLASLEHYAQANEALPLCLDDVLINSDEERVRAALAVLAEVARSIQVLLFTHHEHVVAAAVASVPPEALTVHQLVRGEPPTRRSAGALARV